MPCAYYYHDALGPYRSMHSLMRLLCPVHIMPCFHIHSMHSLMRRQEQDSPQAEARGISLNGHRDGLSTYPTWMICPIARPARDSPSDWNSPVLQVSSLVTRLRLLLSLS